MGGIKLERFLPKNQHTQRNFENFENWTNGETQQLAKIRVLKVDLILYPPFENSTTHNAIVITIHHPVILHERSKDNKNAPKSFRTIFNQALGNRSRSSTKDRNQYRTTNKHPLHTIISMPNKRSRSRSEELQFYVIFK